MVKTISFGHLTVKKKKNAGKGDSSRTSTADDSTAAKAPPSSRTPAKATSSSRAPAKAPSRRSGSEQPRTEATPDVTNEEQEEQTDGVEPLPPIDMWFSNIHLATKCKLSSACDDVKIVPLLEETLGRDDMKWFYEHPIFKHIFHMPRLDNHRLQHLWFTLLRTVRQDEKGPVAWFIVNGVPIRYSLKEHAILSGMNCKMYPRNYTESMGSRRFAIATFGRYDEKVNRITVPEVMGKLETLPRGPTRMKVALLLFLCTVIQKSKTAGFIDPFLIRAVDDLEACRTFPWGRYIFDETLNNIWTAVIHFKGKPQKTYQFPGFIHPLSMLVVEAIPAMKTNFRVTPDHTVDPSCPTMCKTEWALIGPKASRVSPSKN